MSLTELKTEAQKLRDALAFNYSMPATYRHYNRTKLAVIEARIAKLEG